MPGFSGTERDGCLKILNKMSKHDLLSLADTVTNKMIAVENTTEAVEAIVSYSQSAEELLRRRKVIRDLIFKYLAGEGVVMPPNTEKHQLVKRTLELWSSGKVALDQSCEANVDHKSGSAHSPVIPTPDVIDPFVLALDFCKWFYKLLNSQNPSLGLQKEDWGPQHFWPDAKLHILSWASEERADEFDGAELVSLRLLALTKEERLVLNPNLELEGLRALASAHGLVLVAVAGTIHRDDACLGMFEQMFGLIRTPGDNSWKIKIVKMKIRSSNAVGESQSTVPTLSYDLSELQLLSR